MVIFNSYVKLPDCIPIFSDGRQSVNLLGFDMRVIRILIVGWISMQQCH